MMGSDDIEERLSVLLMCKNFMRGVSKYQEFLFGLPILGTYGKDSLWQSIVNVTSSFIVLFPEKITDEESSEGFIVHQF